jgi:hypothetical protein
MSGGLPHSDIHGSKPIPGSPWLNAGYHVLHRLLLPRHPPNALFALDLIQEEQGPSQCQKLVLSHVPIPVRIKTVSVLDLDNIVLAASPKASCRSSPYSGMPNDTDVVSL